VGLLRRRHTIATTIDEIQVLVTAEVDRAIKDLKKVDGQNKKTEKSFLDLAKKVAGPAVAGVILKAFVDISKQSAKLASDAEEIRSKFDVVFGDSAKAVRSWASDYSEAVGRSESDTLKFLGTIGDTLKPLGFTKDAVDDLSKQVVALAGDLGSFNNLPTEEVVAGIQSALVGNVETLRKFGVVANEAAIKQEALNSGLWDGEGALTAQEKAQAILNITLKGTQDAQGDLLRTQDSAANVSVRLESATKDLQIAFGSFVNDAVTPAKSALAEFVSGMAEAITAQATYKDFNEDIKDGVIDNVDAVDDYISSLEAVSDRSEGVRKTRIDKYLEKLYDIREGLNTQDDSWLQKQSDGLARASREADEYANKLLLQEEAQNVLNQLLEDRLSSDEKQAAALQEQIDYWALFRDVPGVQKLINELIADRNKLLDDGKKQTEELAESEQNYYNQFKGYSDEELLAIYNNKRARIEANDEVEADTKLTLDMLRQYWTDYGSSIASSMTGLISALMNLNNQMLTNELDLLDQELQAKLEAAGLLEMTRLEELEHKKALGEEALTDEEERELERLRLEEEYAKKKAQLEYEAALESWELQKALALVNASMAVLNALATQPIWLGLILAATAGIAAGIEVAAIDAAKPTPPAFAQGGEFMTDGPQTILVGDNPGGQERVTVEPVSSNGSNVFSGDGTETVVLMVDGQAFTAHFQKQIDNRLLHSSTGGAI
jgi:hypothetical protein